jgi:hypothetical protein
VTLWTGRCSSRGVVVLGIGIGLVLVAIGAGSAIAVAGSGLPSWAGWLVAALGALVGLLSSLTSSLVVTLSAHDLQVAFGPFGRPRRSIALADVLDASAIIVDPMRWGGWGYRWVPWAHASAAVLRKGPGIELVLRDGRRFTVTVDDAVGGAKAVTAALSGVRGA